MNNRKLMLRQIEATLKKEKAYLKEFNKKLSDPGINGMEREKTLIFRKACIDAINRHEKFKLQYV